MKRSALSSNTGAALAPPHAVANRMGRPGGPVMSSAVVMGSLLAISACAPSTLQLPPTTAPILTEPAGPRKITTLLDLDVVTDVGEAGGVTYVATERGVLSFQGEDAPTRLLSDQPVRSVAVAQNGQAVVATEAGLTYVYGGSVMDTPPPAPPPIGVVRDLHYDAERALWACGDGGLVQLSREGWQRAHNAPCVEIFPSAGSGFWVALSRGLLYFDGQGVVREHAEIGALPAAYARALVGSADGKAYGLFQSASDAYLGYFDGRRWFSYTIGAFERRAVGLARQGARIVLFTNDYAFAISDPESGSDGIRLTALTQGAPDRALAYRLGPAPAQPSEGEPAVAHRPVRLAPVPPNHEPVEAPPLVVAPMDPIAGEAYLVRRSGERTFVARHNQGVLALDDAGAQGSVLSSRNLVAERDLQVASADAQRSWVLTDDGALGEWRDGVLTAVPTPEGTRPWSIAEGPGGVYVASTVPSLPNTVRVHRRTADQWEQVVERALFGGAAHEVSAVNEDPEAGDESTAAEAPAVGEAQAPSGETLRLASVPLIGVTSDNFIWLGVRVAAATESGTRMRGVVVITPANDSVVYHHARANPEVDGQGSLRLPDEVDSMDLSEPNMAWFASLLGAIRLGDHQSVYFGEDRGVRGEVVSDVLVGANGRIWIAAAEGPGYRHRDRFEFRMPGFVKEAKPVRLARAPDGRVWAAGPNGLLVANGDDWTAFGETQGLPTTDFRDVEVDRDGNIWVLAEDRVLVLRAAGTAAASQ